LLDKKPPKIKEVLMVIPLPILPFKLRIIGRKSVAWKNLTFPRIPQRNGKYFFYKN